MTDLDKALKILESVEGGYSNHPSDSGGATMYGVTQAVYDDFRTRIKRQSRQNVARITREEVKELYDIMYWRAARCDRLPWPISYLVFDAAVNSGVERGVRWMQAGLGVDQDGKVGPKTIERAQKVLETGDGKALLGIVGARASFLTSLIRRSPSQLAFLGGWWQRTLKVLGVALTEEQEEA